MQKVSQPNFIAVKECSASANLHCTEISHSSTSILSANFGSPWKIGKRKYNESRTWQVREHHSSEDVVGETRGCAGLRQ